MEKHLLSILELTRIGEAKVGATCCTSIFTPIRPTFDDGSSVSFAGLVGWLRDGRLGRFPSGKHPRQNGGLGRGKLANEVLANVGRRLPAHRDEVFHELDMAGKELLADVAVGKEDDFIGDEPAVDLAQQGACVGRIRFAGNDDLSRL